MIKVSDKPDGGLNISVEFSEPVDDYTKSNAVNAAVWMVNEYARGQKIETFNVE